jgi:hypothetical protein
MSFTTNDMITHHSKTASSGMQNMVYVGNNHNINIIPHDAYAMHQGMDINKYNVCE